MSLIARTAMGVLTLLAFILIPICIMVSTIAWSTSGLLAIMFVFLAMNFAYLAVYLSEYVV